MTSRAQDDPTVSPPVDPRTDGKWWLREQDEREDAANTTARKPEDE